MALEYLDNLIQGLRNANDSSRTLITLITIAGAFILSVIFLRIWLFSYKCFRLYVSSQLCCKTNLLKKYGEWAIVTGATDGIGWAFAHELARRGFSLIIVGRNAQKLSATKLSLERESNVGEVITVKIDLSDSSLENFEQILPQIDPDNRDIGILVNNAGVFAEKMGRFAHSDMEFLRNITNVNVLATVYLTKMILPGMVARGRGLILNVSSSSGLHGFPYASIYAPTKSFVNMFSRMLQIEYASHPIDIVCLTPGVVRTRMFDHTANVHNGKFILPTAKHLAKVVLNSVTTGYQFYDGSFLSHFATSLFGAIKTRKLEQLIFRFLLPPLVRDLRLSPVVKRKNLVVPTKIVST